MLKSHMWLVASIFVSVDLGNGESLQGFKRGRARALCVFHSKTSGGDGTGVTQDCCV